MKARISFIYPTVLLAITSCTIAQIHNKRKPLLIRCDPTDYRSISNRAWSEIIYSWRNWVFSNGGWNWIVRSDLKLAHAPIGLTYVRIVLLTEELILLHLHTISPGRTMSNAHLSIWCRPLGRGFNWRQFLCRAGLCIDTFYVTLFRSKIRADAGIEIWSH